jgi:hypothetical protein
MATHADAVGWPLGDAKVRAMPVDGDVLRSWRRARRWDVPEMAGQLRRVADDHMPVHNALVRMIRRWESVGLRTERYELLYAAALATSPDQLSRGPANRDVSRRADSDRTSFPVSETVDLGTWLEATNAGEGIISYLAATARRLAEDYTRQPPLSVLQEAIETQRRIASLLRSGRQRLAQTRDLCMIGAEVCALLALLCSDVGQYPAAEAYGHVGWICAEESGSSLAGALVLSAQTKTAQWRRRYAAAAAKARQGYEMCPPTGARVLLACQEANAAQALGDVSRAGEALARAQVAAGSVTPDPEDDGTTAWSCPPAREANYAASVNLGAGELERSLSDAGRADEAWASGCPWVYGTWAQVRIGAAIAHVRNGEPEGAAGEIAPVLSLPAEYRVVTLTDRLLYVNQLLRGPHYCNNPAATNLSATIAEFCASSLRKKAITAAAMS